MPPTFVQKDYDADNAVTAVDVTQTSNPTAGNLIVVLIAWWDTTTISSIEDDQATGGNSFSLVSSDSMTGPDLQVAQYRAYNIKGGSSNIVTVNFSASTSFPIVHVIEYSGVKTAADPVDGSSGNTGYGTEATPGSITPGTDGQLLVQLSLNNTTDVAMTHTAGWTERYDDLETYGAHVQDYVQPTAAAINAIVGVPESDWLCCVGSYEADAGGGGGSVPVIIQQML